MLAHLDGASNGGKKDADNGTDASDNPEAHDDFGFAPAFGFQVMVERGGDEDFPMEEFFADELDEAGTGFNDKRKADDWEQKEGVSHHRDYAEASTESERAGIPHHETSRRYIKPDVTEEPADHGHTKTEEEHITLKEGDHAESTVSHHGKAAR